MKIKKLLKCMNQTKLKHIIIFLKIFEAFNKNID